MFVDGWDVFLWCVPPMLSSFDIAMQLLALPAAKLDITL